MYSEWAIDQGKSVQICNKVLDFHDQRSNLLQFCCRRSWGKGSVRSEETHWDASLTRLVSFNPDSTNKDMRNLSCLDVASTWAVAANSCTDSRDICTIKSDPRLAHLQAHDKLGNLAPVNQCIQKAYEPPVPPAGSQSAAVGIPDWLFDKQSPPRGSDSQLLDWLTSWPHQPISVHAQQHWPCGPSLAAKTTEVHPWTSWTKATTLTTAETIF